jgi:hypothetical protein
MSSTDHSLVRANIGDGAAPDFWDVGFTPEQRAYADVHDEDRRVISVYLDPETGEVSLNDGYAPGSQPHRDENTLFTEFADAIVAAIAREIRADNPAYAAFIARAAADEARRTEALKELDAEVEIHAQDAEEADDDLDEVA